MTQAPQTAPAGWYPSPDGAPVRRWWDGTVWTDATQPFEPTPVEPEPVEPEAAEAGPPVSGWPPPEPPRLGVWATLARAASVLAAVTLTVAGGLRAWRTLDPPAWLTEDAALAVTGAGWGLLVLAAVAWLVWQYRLAAGFPPGTLTRTPTWHVLAWLVPVANLWLPLATIAELFQRLTGRAPRWLAAWWGLWLGSFALASSEALWVWAPVAGGVLLLGAAAFAWLVVTRLTRAASGPGRDATRA